MRHGKDIEKLLKSAEITIDHEVDARILDRIQEARSTSSPVSHAGWTCAAVIGGVRGRWAAAAVLVFFIGASVYVSVLHRANEQGTGVSGTTSSQSDVASMPVLPPPGPDEVRITRDLEGMSRNSRILDSGLVNVDFGKGLMWPYHGGMQLEFDRQGPLVLLRVDDGPQTPAGLMLETPEQLAVLDAAARDFGSDHLAIWCFTRPPTGISQLDCADRVTFFQQVEPNEMDDLAGLAGLVNLEALYVRNAGQDSAAVKDLSVLSGFRRLKSLTLYHFPDIQFLGELGPDLTYVDLGRASGLKDISPLGKLKALESLDLSLCFALTDISMLAESASLRRLELRGCGVSDLLALSENPGLTYLGLAGTRVEDLWPLVTVTALDTLNLGSCRNVSDLAPLAYLENLKELNLAGCARVTDISPLRTLEKLESLDLSNCGKVSSIEPLGDLRNLRKLNLSRCAWISDLTPLGSLTHLRTLQIRGCPVLTDIEPIRDLIGRGVLLYASAGIEAQASGMRREIISECVAAASAIVRARVSVSQESMTEETLVLPGKGIRVTKVLYGDVAKGTLRGSFSIGPAVDTQDLAPEPANDMILFLAASPKSERYAVIHRVSGEPLMLGECERIILEALEERNGATVRTQ
jgi:hypothetical protein